MTEGKDDRIVYRENLKKILEGGKKRRDEKAIRLMREALRRNAASQPVTEQTPPQADAATPDNFKDSLVQGLRELRVRGSEKIDITPEFAALFNKEIGSKIPDEALLKDLEIFDFRYTRGYGEVPHRFSVALRRAQKHGIKTVGDFRSVNDSSYLGKQMKVNKERTFEFMRDAFKLPPESGRVTAQ